MVLLKEAVLINNKTLKSSFTYMSLEIKNNRNRSNCLCLASIDIGAYSSCDHGCTYCYACNHKIVKKNMLMHNENSPLLLGELNDDDQIIKRTVTSNKKRQLQLNIF